MAVEVSPLAGNPAPASMLVNVPRLVTAYFSGKPDPAVASQRVAFGTSEDGGFKYNPPNGGPADTDVTTAIERAANAFLEDGLRGLQRISYHRAHKAACVHRHDYIGPYVADLANVIDMEAIRASGVKIGI